jgi:tripeptide aminopeptidase
MPLGRIDSETTANIGVIEGGTATNIVPDELHVRGEARSRNRAKLEAQTAAMVRAFEEAAARHGGRADIKIHRSYNGYHWTKDMPVVNRAMDAARRLGMEPLLKDSGGGADANVFADSGITCAVLSTGMEEVHTAQEHIAIADMVDCVRLLQAILTDSSR